MKLIALHDINSPNQEIPMDAEDFSVCLPYLSGSSIKLKSGDSFLVHERPHEVMELIRSVE